MNSIIWFQTLKWPDCLPDSAHANDLQGATVQQMSQLRRMAEQELACLIPLQDDCDAVLVPYIDKAGRVKVVSWLAELIM